MGGIRTMTGQRCIIFSQRQENAVQLPSYGQTARFKQLRQPDGARRCDLLQRFAVQGDVEALISSSLASRATAR